MINSRALFLTGILLIVFVTLVAKLFTIQIAKNEYYSLLAEKQQNKPVVVRAERGLIKGLNGEVLSFTRDYISFFVDTRMMNAKRVDSIAALFSKVFNKPKFFYKKMIDEGVNNVCIEKKAPMEKAIELKKIVIEGMFYQEDFSRVYPYGSLASHVIGYVNKDIVGVEGIEKKYNKELTGTDGYFVFERDVLGRIVSVNEKLSSPTVSGNQIILTINKSYQKILEEELSAGLKKYGGESAVGIIMNPNTGEILALANSPDFDPANYQLFSAEARRNRALTDTYEPGSTIKSIVLAIMLEKNLIKEDEVIDTEMGNYIYKNVKISDSHPFASLTVREALEQSSNVGMTKLSFRLNDDILYKYLRDFGFSNATQIDLPSEAEGLLKKPDRFSGLTKAFMSFGYELSVTPLQIISAYSALVNGGTLHQPYIVSSVVSNTGNILLENKPKKIRTVISKSTSDKIKDFMVGVVEQGTGTAAQLEDVIAGGKTGTSQRLMNNSYSSSHHNSSFVGFFPADHPKIVAFILVNAPQIGKYGGLVAAPIFQKVSKRMIEADLNLVPSKKKIHRKENFVEQLIADLKTAPKKTTRSYLNVGEKNENDQPRKFFNGNRTTMPNLMNKSIRDVVAQLNELGLKYKVSGTGKVVWQSIEPGANIYQDSICIIKCDSSIKKATTNSNL